jgi:hypothetical protein
MDTVKMHRRRCSIESVIGAEAVDRLREAGYVAVAACPVDEHPWHGRRRVLTGRLFGPSHAEEPSYEEVCDGERLIKVSYGEWGRDPGPDEPPEDEPF